MLFSGPPVGRTASSVSPQPNPFPRSGGFPRRERQRVSAADHRPHPHQWRPRRSHRNPIPVWRSACFAPSPNPRARHEAVYPLPPSACGELIERPNDKQHLSGNRSASLSPVPATQRGAARRPGPTSAQLRRAATRRCRVATSQDAAYVPHPIAARGWKIKPKRV